MKQQFKKLLFIFLIFSNFANATQIIYSKNNSANIGKSLTIEVYAPNQQDKPLQTCNATLANSNFVCDVKIPTGVYKLKFINDLHKSVWSGNKFSFATAETIKLAEAPVRFLHFILARGKKIENQPQLAKINAGMANLKESGEFDTIYDKWFK